MIFSVKQKYIVMVELPRPDGWPLDPWAVVAVVEEIGQDEAIEKAIDETPELTDWVPPGIAKFMAIPVRSVPIKRGVLAGQGHNGNVYDLRNRIQRRLIKL